MEKRNRFYMLTFLLLFIFTSCQNISNESKRENDIVKYSEDCLIYEYSHLAIFSIELKPEITFLQQESNHYSFVVDTNQNNVHIYHSDSKFSYSLFDFNIINFEGTEITEWSSISSDSSVVLKCSRIFNKKQEVDTLIIIHNQYLLYKYWKQ